MQFSSPSWLLALFPWLLLAGWMFLGRRRRIRVPFLPLWEGPALADPPKRGIRHPPISVLFALAGLLLAIVAAGGPSFAWGGLVSAESQLVVIVDHGLTMSGQTNGELRFVTTARELSRSLLADKTSSFPIAVVDPLTGRERRTNLAGLIDVVKQLPPTAIDMRPQTGAAISRLVTHNGPPVVVLTDHWLPSDQSSPRLVQVSPPGPWSDFAITTIAARAKPLAQVMVRIRNDSTATQVAGAITSAGKSVSRTLSLPTSGQERNYFFDMPLGDVVEATIGDKRAYLLREAIETSIEPAPDLPAALRRMIAVYAKARRRSTADASQRQMMQVVTSFSEVTGEAPAVIAGAADIPTNGSIVAENDPVTRDVDWSALPTPIRVTAHPPEGWRVLLSNEGHPMLATRDEPARQVWVGFDSPGFSATPAFVVFWTNVLDWCAGAGQVYSESPITSQMDDWRRMPLAGDPPSLPLYAPGIYTRGDRTRRAFNAPSIPTPIAINSGQAGLAQRLAGMIAEHRSGRDASPIFLWLSLVCLIGAASFWKSVEVARSAQTARSLP